MRVKLISLIFYAHVRKWRLERVLHLNRNVKSIPLKPFRRTFYERSNLRRDKIYTVLQLNIELENIK